MSGDPIWPWPCDKCRTLVLLQAHRCPRCGSPRPAPRPVQNGDDDALRRLEAFMQKHRQEIGTLGTEEFTRRHWDELRDIHEALRAMEERERAKALEAETAARLREVVAERERAENTYGSVLVRNTHFPASERPESPTVRRAARKHWFLRDAFAQGKGCVYRVPEDEDQVIAYRREHAWPAFKALIASGARHTCVKCLYCGYVHVVVLPTRPFDQLTLGELLFLQVASGPRSADNWEAAFTCLSCKGRNGGIRVSISYDTFAAHGNVGDPFSLCRTIAIWDRLKAWALQLLLAGVFAAVCWGTFGGPATAAILLGFAAALIAKRTSLALLLVWTFAACFGMLACQWGQSGDVPKIRSFLKSALAFGILGSLSAIFAASGGHDRKPEKGKLRPRRR